MGPEWNERSVMVFQGALDTHIKTGEFYDTLKLASIFTMEPGSRDKSEGRAIVASQYCEYDGRVHEVQRDRGEFVMLCADIDKGDHTLASIEGLVKAFCGDAAWLIYASANARPGNMRWRVFIPLQDVVGFADWYDAQNAFFTFMERAGIPVDRSLDRAGQPIYLPNVPDIHAKSGEPLRSDATGAPLYYKRSTTGTNARGLDLGDGPVSAGIHQIRHQRALDDLERERLKKEAERRRASRPKDGAGQIIAEFNRGTAISDLLQAYGYKQSPRHAEDWRSPYQTGDSYATRVMDGDKWVSLSGSDTGQRIGAPHQSGCYGDAYDLFVHYEHKGDHKAAFRQLYQERDAANPRPARQMPEPPEDRWAPMPDEAWDGPSGDDYAADAADEAIEAHAEELEKATETFPLMTAEEAENLPPPDWLIEDLIPDHGLSIVYGDPGSGKSFGLIDAALRIALGVEWHGQKTKQAGVLYIAGEGVRGLGKRIKGWRLHHKVPNLTGVPFLLMPTAAQMLDPADVNKLIRTIDEAKRRLSFDIGLIIIDTVSRSIAGQDENGQETMSAFVRSCDRVREHCGGSVIGAHHSGKDKEKGMRGSTVLLGACDAAIQSQKSEDLVTLTCQKQKDGEAGRPITFKMEKISWLSPTEDDPDHHESTLVPIRTDPPKVSASDITMDMIRQAFGLMIDAWRDGTPMSSRPETKNQGRFAPGIFARKIGGDANAWTSLLASWLENGNVRMEIYDKKAKAKGLQVLDAIV